MTDKDVVRFSPGDSAIITMDAYPGDTLIAEIAELGVLADPVTGTYESELQILDPMPGFRTGFICRAWVFPKQTQKGVLVPMDALLDAKDNKAVVYIFINGKAEKRDVITGTVKEGDVLVTSGIAAGDSLIVSGAPYITGDANVVLKK